MPDNIKVKRDKVKKHIENYDDLKKGKLGHSAEKIENYLNEILPTYRDVFHDNTVRGRRELLPERNDGNGTRDDSDETRLPIYNIGIFLVGYSSLPIVLSLAEIQPTEQIYFLYSSDTREYLGKISDRLFKMLNGSNDELSALVTYTVLHNLDQSALEINAPSDPVSTFKRIKEIIDSIEESEDKRIALDITGGKKTMIGGGFTAGAIWASRWSAAAKELVPFCDMYYIDSKEYDPNHGRPVPGTEFLSQLENPYDVYNVQSVRQAEKLFEKHNYEAAADLWADVTMKLKNKATQYDLETEQKAVHSNLAMANCYRLWDDFAYEEAKEHKGFNFPNSKRQGFWGYQEQHTNDANDAIDVLDILSAVANRDTLFADDKHIIHYAVDRYQNAVRRNHSGKLYDAIVRFSQVIEMLCIYRIYRLVQKDCFISINTRKPVRVKLQDLDFGLKPSIRLVFGTGSVKIQNGDCYIERKNQLDVREYGYNSVDNITDIIQSRHDFIHFVKTHGIDRAKEITKKLQHLTYKLIRNFSENYLCSAKITLDNLLMLHTFRQTSLSGAEQFIKELNLLENNSSDENYAMYTYNEKLQTFDGKRQKMIAKALEEYWTRINKWEGDSLSDKQREKVRVLQSILEDNNE